LTAKLLLDAGNLDSGQACEQAVNVYYAWALGINGERPDSIEKIESACHLSYRKVRRCIQTLIEVGIGSGLDIPPSQQERKEKQGSRRDLMVLSPRKTLEVLEMRADPAMSGYFIEKKLELHHKTKEELDCAEKVFREIYGDCCCKPFLNSYGFDGVVPLRSALRVFIYAYASYLLEGMRTKLGNTGIIFVTRRGTMLSFPPFKKTLIESTRALKEDGFQLNIVNYFSSTSIPPSSLLKDTENIRLILIPSSLVRNDRYILIGDHLISCHLRPSPYRNKQVSERISYDNSYTMDIVTRKAYINDFKNNIESWDRLGLTTPCVAKTQTAT
jgi:hypothetical protein